MDWWKEWDKTEKEDHMDKSARDDYKDDVVDLGSLMDELDGEPITTDVGDPFENYEDEEEMEHPLYAGED